MSERRRRRSRKHLIASDLPSKPAGLRIDWPECPESQSGPSPSTRSARSRCSARPTDGSNRCGSASPFSSRAAPLLFTGRAVVTGGVYAPLDILSFYEPIASQHGPSAAPGPHAAALRRRVLVDPVARGGARRPPARAAPVVESVPPRRRAAARGAAGGAAPPRDLARPASPVAAGVDAADEPAAAHRAARPRTS